MSANIKSQRGLTLFGMIFFGIIAIIIAVLAMRIVPEVIEYSKIVSDIKAIAQDPALKQASVADVRNAYQRRATVDHISAVKPIDLDVVRNGNQLVLSFAYRKEFPLAGPVSLVIDFQGSTDQ